MSANPENQKERARISVVAITGNCERYIRRWLANFGWADEIVLVVATGSEYGDSTRDIALEAGARVEWYHNRPNHTETMTAEDVEAGYEGEVGDVIAIDSEEWPHVDDFAAARNKATELATGDWLIWADMDDVLPQGAGETIREFLALIDRHHPDADAIAVPYQVPEDGLETDRERIWRRGSAVWTGRVHEHLKFHKDDPKFIRMSDQDPALAAVKWVHMPSGDRRPNDERNLRILESIPPRERTISDRFHLVKSLDACGRRGDAVKVAIGLVRDPKVEAPEKAEMFFNMGAWAEDFGERHAMFLQALSADPKRREAYAELAQTCLNTGHYADALGWSTAMMAHARPGEYLWSAREKYYRWCGLGIHCACLRANGRREEADTLQRNWFFEHDGDITLVHATRGRAPLAWRCRSAWLEAANQPDRIEHIFVCDADDPHAPAVLLGYGGALPQSRGPVAAWNAGAAMAMGQIIIQLSDDWVPVRGWDDMIRAEFAEANEAGRPAVLAVGDGGRRDDLLCMAILNRERLVQQGGLMFHPGFFSVFSDNWFTWLAQKEEVVIDARDRIVFEHRHPAFGKAENDVTYARSNAPANYAEGHALFELLVFGYGKKYYGQTQQDLIAEKWFAEHGERSRFYVDIGAYDGVTFSNTKRFEDMGWDGICIEPHPVNFAKLVKNRPGARCWKFAASDVQCMAVLSYPVRDDDAFHGLALATLEKPDQEKWKSQTGRDGWKEVEVSCAPILKTALGEVPDLLSVDCEGHDLAALRGWPWATHKPRLVIVEKGTDRDGLLALMRPMGYTIHVETNQDLFLQLLS